VTIVLFDTPRSHRRLYPISLSRPICHIRHGLFTPSEWYATFTRLHVAALSYDYLQIAIPQDDGYICVDASIVPTRDLLLLILHLQPGQMLEDENGLVAFSTTKPPLFDTLPLFFNESICIEAVQRLGHPMDLVKTNSQKILDDISMLDKSHYDMVDQSVNRIFGSHPVYAAPGSKVQGCLFNTEDGPVFIGENALVMEGCSIRGPVAIMESAVVKMGTQLYPGTTIGRFATAGGEIKNSIIGDFSNKAHHGYLGDSILGQWCNLGAGTSNSNVKNNAGMVKMWSDETRDLISIGQKAGVVMGDFTRTAINASINTGSTIGTCCSLHHSGFTDNHIPSFSWGPGESYTFDKAIRDIKAWYAFKNQEPPANLETTLLHLYRSMQAV
jgi:UDP-N-acetylglucosamine diphosphorylase/glucosamine-1-phosphate N-acetyltransferase